MTIYEHYMLYICFGAMTGWLISGLVFMIVDIIRGAKKKIKARREKKQLKVTEKTSNE